MSRLSPLQDPRLKELAFQTRFAAEVLKAYNAFLAGVSDIKNIIAEARDLSATAVEHMSRIRNLPEGKKGDRGEQGERGEKGDQGEPGRDGVDGVSPDIDTIVAKAVSRIRVPKDGKDAVVDNEAIVKELIEELKELPITAFPNVEREFVNHRAQLAGKIYGKDTWARGGGMTMSAGSNITLVPKADGTVEINASGGASGTNVATQYSLTAVQSGADVTIDLTQLTNYATFSDLILVMRNNIPQTETINFTFVDPIITITNADSSEVYSVQYAYA